MDMGKNSAQRTQTSAAFAAFLRSRRGHHHWTVQQLAAKSGLTKSMISRLENEHTVMDVSHMKALADAFGLSIQEFAIEAIRVDPPPAAASRKEA